MGKLVIFTTLILVAFCSLAARAQEAVNEEKTSVKTGWNFGLLPAVSYNSDLGFQYGGLINFFDYGDGSRYPNYNQSVYFEASRYTKGSGLLRFFYDSDQLIKNIRTTLDMSYMPEQAIDFLGFNGYDAVYNSDWADQDAAIYRSRMFYKHRRTMWRIHLDINGPLLSSSFRWAGGLEFYDIKTASVDIDKLNKGKSDDELLPTHDQVPGLFELYQRWGMIPDGEASGGRFLAFKAGLVYDTRNFQPSPTKGVWTDVILYVVPKSFSSLEEGFARLSITHRQYFSIINDRFWFAGRLGWQSTIGGHVPFYVQPLMITTQLKGSYSEGLGGQRSLRGIIRNRVVGDAFVYGNAELRAKIYQTRRFNQNFYVALNAFVDAGMVTKKIDWVVATNLNDMVDDPENYFNTGSEKLHWSSGAGVKLVMNENFILSGEYGLALDKQDGSSGLYIGLNYLF